MTPRTIIEFWFSEPGRQLWFNSTPEADRALHQRYGELWQQAANGAFGDWEETAEGVLALAIVLDQFPLNMFRGQALSFSTEATARAIAERAIERGFDRNLEPIQRFFLYLPFMHSESLADQDRSVELFRDAGLTDSLKWAEHHRAIIRRFGRFPHRNAPLGRESTTEELAWLASDEAFKG